METDTISNVQDPENTPKSTEYGPVPAAIQPEEEPEKLEAPTSEGIPIPEPTEQPFEEEPEPDRQDDAGSPSSSGNESDVSIRSLERRKKKSRKRLSQTTGFFKLLMDRVTFLEQELDKLKGTQVMSRPVTPVSVAPRSVISVDVAEEGEKPREDGENSDCSVSGDEEDESDIFELPEGPKRALREQIWKESAAADSAASGVENLVTEAETKIPSRIRIHSEGINRALEQVTSYKWGTHSMCTLVQPFKTVVRCEGELRKEVERLAALYPDPASFDSPDPGNVLSSEKQHFGVTHLAGSDDKTLQSKEPASDACEQISEAAKKKAREFLEQKNMTKEEFKEGRAALEDLRFFIQFIDSRLKGLLTVKRQVEGGPLKTIAFSNLFLLFKPGDVVLSQDRKQAYEILAVSGGLPLDKEKTRAAEYGRGTHSSGLYPYNIHDVVSPFILDCYHFDFNGTMYGPAQRSFAISYFHDEKPISYLPVFPERCLEKGQNYRDDLINRGRKFVDLVKDGKRFAHKSYSGLGTNVKGDIEEIDSQVIIDFSEAFRKHPDWAPELGLTGITERDPREMTDCTGTSHFTENDNVCVMCEYDNYWPDEEIIHQLCADHLATVAEEMQPTQEVKDMLSFPRALLLLPARLFGFVLRSRKWVSLDVNNIGPLDSPEESFKDLVINPEHKMMVQAIVETHSRGSNTDGEQASNAAAKYQEDIIRGKGTGRILLLHGPPGVGKTSTAECVADLTGRPLFQITCGDIGTEPEDVERNLDESFLLAHRWGCVLLLDEADVFLQERDRVNLKRNSLVSVFLRVLEYYPGILILTTNREGIFDEAFRSRIHIILHYERPTLENWLQIWRNNIRRAKKQFDIDDEAIIKWAGKSFEKLNWNGRQIRNAFQAATALANYNALRDQRIRALDGIAQNQDKTPKIELHKGYFKQVANLSTSFDLYIDSIFGVEKVEDRVLKAGNRNDGWGRTPNVNMHNQNMGNMNYRMQESPRASPMPQKGRAPGRRPVQSGYGDQRQEPLQSQYRQSPQGTMNNGGFGYEQDASDSDA